MSKIRCLYPVLRHPALALVSSLLILLPSLRLSAESIEQFLQPHVLTQIEASRQAYAGRERPDADALVDASRGEGNFELDPFLIIALSDELLQKDPANDRVRVARASAWNALGQYTRAMQELDRLTPEAAAWDQTRYERARALRARGRLGAALDQLRAIDRQTIWWVYAEEDHDALEPLAAAWEKDLKSLLLRPTAPLPPTAFAAVRAMGAVDTAFEFARIQLAARPGDPEALKTLGWLAKKGAINFQLEIKLLHDLAPQLAAAARLEPGDRAGWQTAIRAGSIDLYPDDTAALATLRALLADAAKAGFADPVKELQVDELSVRSLDELKALEPRIAELAKSTPEPRIHENRMRLFLSSAGPAVEAALKDRSRRELWSAALTATRAVIGPSQLDPAIYLSMLDVAREAGHVFPTEQAHADLYRLTEPLELIAAIRDALPRAATDPELHQTIDSLITTRLRLDPASVGVTRNLLVDVPPYLTEDTDITKEEAAALAALPTPLERAQGWARRHAPAAALAALGDEGANEDFPTARLRVILLQQLGRLNEALLTLDRAAWRLREDAESAKFPWAGLRAEFETMHRAVAKAEAACASNAMPWNWANLAAAWTGQPCPSYPKALLAAAKAMSKEKRNPIALRAVVESLKDYFKGLPPARLAQLTSQGTLVEFERILGVLYELPEPIDPVLEVSVIRLAPPGRQADLARSWLRSRIKENPGQYADVESLKKVLTFYLAEDRRAMEDAEQALASLPANSPYAPDVIIARERVDALWAKEGLYRPETRYATAEDIARRNQLTNELVADLDVSCLEAENLTDAAEAKEAWVELAAQAWNLYEKFRLKSLAGFTTQVEALPDAAERARLRQVLAEQQPFGPPEASPEVRTNHRLVAAQLTTGERAAAVECILVVCRAYSHLQHGRLAAAAWRLYGKQHVRLAEVEAAKSLLDPIDCTGDYAEFKQEFDAINAHMVAGNYAAAQTALNQIALRARGNPFYHLIAATIATDTDREDAYRLLIAMPNELMIVPNIKERYLKLDKIQSNRRDYQIRHRIARGQEIRNRLVEINQQLQAMNQHIDANTDRMRSIGDSLGSTSYSQLSSRKDEVDRLDANTAMWANSARQLLAERQDLREELAKLEGK